MNDQAIKSKHELTVTLSPRHQGGVAKYNDKSSAPPLIVHLFVNLFTSKLPSLILHFFLI